MVQENNETTSADSADTSTEDVSSTATRSSRKKKVAAPKYDATQERHPSMLIVYKFTSRYGEVDKDGNPKEYKVAAKSLRSAARLVNIKADSITQTGVEEYSSD